MLHDRGVSGPLRRFIGLATHPEGITGSLFPGFQVMDSSTVQNHVKARYAGNQLQQDVVQVSVQIETAMEGNFRKYGAAPSKPVYFSLGSSSSDKRGRAA